MAEITYDLASSTTYAVWLRVNFIPKFRHFQLNGSERYIFEKLFMKIEFIHRVFERNPSQTSVKRLQTIDFWDALSEI